MAWAAYNVDSIEGETTRPPVSRMRQFTHIRDLSAFEGLRNQPR